MFLLDVLVSPLALLLYPPIGITVGIIIAMIIIVTILIKRR